jgi:hypothetical protein
LEYAGEVLANDKEVVMAAVSNAGKALRFAGPATKADKEVCVRLPTHATAREHIL